jgi:cytochrome oxidase Cu insertion factor (SCO1/SenC/PrrC family)
MQGQRFAQLQNLLGSRLGKDVFLVSITLDPVNDTPVKLKAYANQYGAKPGWTFLTGTVSNVQQAVQKFVALGPPGKDVNHTPILVAINQPANRMKIDFSIGPPNWMFAYVTTWNPIRVVSTGTVSH